MPRPGLSLRLPNRPYLEGLTAIGEVGDRENTRARSVAAPLRRPWSRSVVVEVIATLAPRLRQPLQEPHGLDLSGTD